MIKAIVLDVDGVIVGTRQGHNFPHPSSAVSHALRTIKKNGISVSFLSAKTAFSIAENVKRVGIEGIHVADGGAVLFNPMQNSVVQVHSVPKDEIAHVVADLPDFAVVYLFTSKNYYVRTSQCNDPLVPLYIPIVEREPVVVDSFDQTITQNRFSKVNIYVQTSEQKTQINNILQKTEKLSWAWASNPKLPGYLVCVITAAGVSKRAGVEALATRLNVTLDTILAVGDTMHDWEFIQICGYKGIMANATEELKGVVDFKAHHTFLGGHVDEDGVLNIFRHFNLI